MNASVRLLIFAGVFALSANVFAQDTNFWIFFGFGQSNMEGPPGIEEQDKSGVDDRFQVFATVDFPKQNRTKANGSARINRCESAVSTRSERCGLAGAQLFLSNK